jgi:SAM-dependent methyltransferase
VSEYRYEGSELLKLGEHLRNYNASIADLVARAAPPNARTLDFGAGFGTLTKDVAERIGKPDCVEPDPRQREQLEALGFRCYADVADVPQGQYDYVYSSNVLEHIEDDTAVLGMLFRVLKPGGRIVLYLPAFMSLYSDVDRAIGHYRRYDASLIKTRLRAAGFVVQRVYYADMLGFLVNLLFKYGSNRVGSVNARSMTIYDSVVFPVTRAIERLIRPPFGKNVVAVASRDGAVR